MTNIDRFNIRVYGIIINPYDEVFFIHEPIGDFEFTKFPGGGMEFGEGTRDCLKREFMEEAQLEVEIGEHIYTTDFYQQSAFRNTDQLIFIYYKVVPKEFPIQINLEEFEVIEHGKPEYLRFFWVRRRDLKPEMLTFPIDKKVCEMIT